MDVEKCHDEVGVEDRTGRELAGEDSTKDTWIHASPFSRTGRNQILDEHDLTSTSTNDASDSTRASDRDCRPDAASGCC